MRYFIFLLYLAITYFFIALKIYIMINQDVSIPFEVIERFAAKNSLPLEQAISIYDEVIAYLDKKDGSSPTQLTDEAWHAFILHTKEYQQFCKQRHGHFIHHIPHGMKPDFLNQKVRILAAKKSLALAGAACNDGTGDGNCSNNCGQSSCNNDGNG